MNEDPTLSTVTRGLPFWRDVRVLRIVSQIIFIIALAIVAGLLYANLTRGLEKRGLAGGFGFLGLEAGFEIGEGIKYEPSDSYGRAFLVGVVNTLRVTILGIVLVTVLGVVAGVARLSTNWLVNKIASVYIEIIRNTPLLVQLFFWYFAVILKAPPVNESLRLPGSIFVNRRGVYLPWLSPSPTLGSWSLFLLGGVMVTAILWVVLTRLQRRTGRSTYPAPAAIIAFLLMAGAGWLLVEQTPLVLEVPTFLGFNFEGGVRLTPEFTGMLVGLVVYTGAFIAEVVRGGIQSVQRGQIEAGRAVGLNEMQTLRLVIFPQALRIIIPSLTSQYLNLAKNSSLAIAIGFPDLFNVAGTIFNQSGRSVPVITLVMGSYLVMSLITSLFMNIYNRRVLFVER